MKNRFYLILQIMISLFFMISCQYSKQKGSNNTRNSNSELNTLSLNNNFEKVNELVLKTQCLTCHSEASGNRGGLNLEGYAQVKKNLNQIAYRVLETQDMPANGLKGKQLELIRLWLNSGAPEKNTSSEFKNTISLNEPMNWLVVKTKILDEKCLMCHTSTYDTSTEPVTEILPEGKVSFHTLALFKQNADQIFKVIYVNQSMPPSDFFNALTLTEKQALMKWMSQGFND